MRFQVSAAGVNPQVGNTFWEHFYRQLAHFYQGIVPSQGLPTASQPRIRPMVPKVLHANRLEDERVSRDVASLTPILAISKILTWPILRA
jgi:hypothetical protein